MHSFKRKEKTGDFLKVAWHPGAELRPDTSFLIPSPVLLPVQQASVTQVSAINKNENNNNNNNWNSDTWYVCVYVTKQRSAARGT